MSRIEWQELVKAALEEWRRRQETDAEVWAEMSARAFSQEAGVHVEVV